MGDIPKWLNMADWSDMPDVYVTKAECQQGMFWRIEACSVPMVMLPEVRLIRADIARAELEAAVAAERERMGPIADILPDAVIAAEITRLHAALADAQAQKEKIDAAIAEKGGGLSDADTPREQIALP